MNEFELSEFCRRKRLYREQISAWREVCKDANAGMSSKADRARLTKQTRRIKKLEGEVRRKDKALAEAEALLVLQEEVQAIWEDDEDEKSTFWPDNNRLHLLIWALEINISWQLRRFDDDELDYCT